MLQYPFAWRLRCRFDYADGRPSWFSQWDKSGPNPQDMAAFQSRECLLRACVEGKEISSKSIKIMAECNGHDFVKFEWLAAVAPICPSMFGSFEGTNIGLVLVTSEERCIVEGSGQIYVESRLPIQA